MAYLWDWSYLILMLMWSEVMLLSLFILFELKLMQIESEHMEIPEQQYKVVARLPIPGLRQRLAASTVPSISEEALMQHPYWNGRDGQPADWELLAEARLPSPLVGIAREQLGRWAEKERQRRLSNVAAVEDNASAVARDLAVA